MIWDEVFCKTIPWYSQTYTLTNSLGERHWNCTAAGRFWTSMNFLRTYVNSSSHVMSLHMRVACRDITVDWFRHGTLAVPGSPCVSRDWEVGLFIRFSSFCPYGLVLPGIQILTLFSEPPICGLWGGTKPQLETIWIGTDVCHHLAIQSLSARWCG